jgi:uncharacterized protein (TIGR03067 family)
MILPTKPLLIAAVGVVSLSGAGAAWRMQQASREQAVREAVQHLEDGTAPPEEKIAPPQGDQQDLSADFPTLNADEYRQEISDIDRLIFEELPLTSARRMALTKKLEALAQRMESSSDSHFIAIEAHEIRQLADYADKLPPSGPRTALANNWMRIRNNVFDDRSWFARSAADLEPTAETVGLPAPKRPPDPFIPPEPADEANPTLEGRWRVKAMFGDGKPTSDLEMANALWMFDRNHLFIATEKGPVEHYTFTGVSDERGAALHLEPDPSNAGPAEEGWMNYEFAGADLKLAFYDGLGERPEGFTPPAGKHEPLFLVVVLQRER